jgi:hypothetical protein
VKEGNMSESEIGNQQEIPTEGELGWLTGIIEGEGSITMNVRQKTWKGWQGIGVDVGISICNKDAGIISKCMEIMHKLGVTPHVCEGHSAPIRATLKDGTEKVYHNTDRPLLQLQLSRMGSIKLILMTIEPYMIGDKKHRARLIIDFVDRRLARKGAHTKGGASWYDDYDWKIVEAFYKITKGKLPPQVEAILRDYTSNTQTA